MAGSGGTVRKQRILVVDDEPSVIDAVATVLRDEGYDVDEAATGQQAIERLATFEPQLVVLDWMLPDIAGVAVSRTARARGFRQAILFLTAKHSTEDKVEALAAGADDYMTKPFSLDELLARVEALLRRFPPAQG